MEYKNNLDRVIVLISISIFFSSLMLINLEKPIIYDFLIFVGVSFYLIGLNFTIPKLKKHFSGYNT